MSLAVFLPFSMKPRILSNWTLDTWAPMKVSGWRGSPTATALAASANRVQNSS